MLKRWISILVVITMLGSVFGATAFADEGTPVQGEPQITEQPVTPEPAQQADPASESKADDGAVDNAPATDNAPVNTEQPADAAADESDEPQGDPADGDPEAEPELPAEEAVAEQIAAATAAIAALPTDITWNAFAAVEAAGAALAAVPAERQAEVVGADKLTAAIETLLTIYAQAQAALDPSADIWENQQAIKAFVQMKKQMDAAQYVKPTADGDMSLMDGAAEPADLSWLDDALAAYATAEATIIPDGADGDMELMAAAMDYQKLQDALDAVNAKGTIKINNDIELTEQLVANKAVAYTINTNKKTLTFKANVADAMDMVGVVGFLVTAGTVTIKGGGELVCTDSSIKTVLCVTDDAVAVTLDGVDVTANQANGIGTYFAVAVYQTGATFTVKNSSLTTKTMESGATALLVQGKDESNKAKVYVSSGTKLVGYIGIAIYNHVDYVLDGATLNATECAVDGYDYNEDSDESVTGVIQNCILTTDAGESSCVVVLNHSKLTIVNTTISGYYGVDVCKGSVHIKDCKLNGEKEAIYINPPGDSTKVVDVTVENVQAHSDFNSPFVFERYSDGETIKLAVKNSVITTGENNPPIYWASKGNDFNDEDLKNITLENTVTNTPLQAGTYTPAEGQQLFGTIEGGSVVAATLTDALKIADVYLTADYTNADEDVIVAAGSILDTDEFELNVKSVTVNGRMAIYGSGGLATETTVTSTGLFYLGYELCIALKGEEVFGEKAVFGLSKGAEMTVKNNGNAEGIDFTLTKGEATIQTPIGGNTQFEMVDGDTLKKAEGTKMWLATDVEVKSLRGIADGTLSYELVKIGSKVYDNLPEAITAGGTIKVMRNLTGVFAVTQPIIATKAFTLDLQGYTVDFDFEETNLAGLEIAPQNKANITIKNGTLNKISNGEAMMPFIVAGNQANITLDGVTAELSGDGNATVLVQDGATVTVINKSTITSTDGAVWVMAGGKLVAKNSTLEGNMESRTLIAEGASDKTITMQLDNVTAVGTIALGDYVSLSMNACTVTGKKYAIFNEGSLPSTDITITGGTLNTTEEFGDGFALSLSMAKTLNITDTTIHSACHGIALYNGEIELNNVTINANHRAMAAIATMGGGSQPIKITVNGGTISSENNSALLYGYETDDAEDKPLTITLNNTKLYAAGNKAPIVRSDNVQTKVSVNGITTLPHVNKDLLTVAQGQKVFNANVDGDDVSYIRETLSQVISDVGDYATITLSESYGDGSEKIEVPRGVEIELGNDVALDVDSLAIYGTVDAFATGASIKANSLQVLAESDMDCGSLRIASIDQLKDGTAAEVIACHPAGSLAYVSGYVDIGSDCVFYDYLAGNVLFGLAEAGHASVSACNEGTDDAPRYVKQYTILAGTVFIRNYDQSGEFDIGNDYLHIEDGAALYVPNGMTVKQSDHITGSDVVYPDVVDFEIALDALPHIDNLSYVHYYLVHDAMRAEQDVMNSGHDQTAPAKALSAKLKEYTDIYMYRYIATSPNLFMIDRSDNTVEVGATSTPIDVYKDTMPTEISDLLDTEFGIAFEMETDDPKKFTFNTQNGAVTAGQTAEPNDKATVTVKYVQTADVEEKVESHTLSKDYRVVPSSAGASLSEIVLESYNRTVNLQYKSQEFDLYWDMVYDHGTMDRSKDDQYTVTGATLSTGEKLSISEMYEVAYSNEPQMITLKRKAGTDLSKYKNKTLTGRVTFTVHKDGDAEDTTLPATALLSIKVTDVAPKVTVKFDTLEVFTNEKSKEEYNGFIYDYGSVWVTLGGVNANDVDTLDIVPDDENIHYGYVGGYYAVPYMAVTSKVPLTKGTYKPVITVKFKTDANGNCFKDLKLEKNGVGTVALKTVETSPAVKLQKTSATISTPAGAEVKVEVVPTNKKAPYDVYKGIRKVAVYEGSSKNLVPSTNVSATLNQNIITLETLNPIEKSLKLTLRLYFKHSDDEKYKDLPFTLNVKALAVKLSKTSVDFNVKNEYNDAMLPIVVTPESDVVTLEKIGVKVGKVEQFYEPDENGTINVNGIRFRCVNDNGLLVDANYTNLEKGNLKYNLYFKDVQKAVAFTVKVADKYQTVKLSKTSVSINTTFTDFASVGLAYSDSRYALTDTNLDIQCSRAVGVEYADGELLVRLSPDAAKTETVLITVKDANTDPKKSTLKLTVKKVDANIQMKVSVKGKLDTLNDESTVTAKVTFSGTASSIDMKTLASLFNKRDFTLFDESVLEIKGYEYDDKNGGQLTIGWQQGANLIYGAGKYNLDMYVYKAVQDFEFVSWLPKPVAVSAAEGRVKLTAQEVLMYRAIPYGDSRLDIDTGVDGCDVTNVFFAKSNPTYAIERGMNGDFYIRYTSKDAADNPKLKAKDSATLSVMVEGSGKIYTVKVSILNIEKGVK